MKPQDQLPPQPTAAPTLDALAGTVTTTATAVLQAARRDHDGDGLDAAAVVLRAMDRLAAAVIVVLQTADHDQVLTGHGLTRDSWLRAIAGRTGSDAGMLLAAAERLGDMPAVTSWFHNGTLSWGAVRGIVAATRNLTGEQRRWVDATLADHDPQLRRLDDDQVVAAVDGLVARARPDLHADRETSALARRWLAIHPRLDGTADIHGTLDIDTTAVALATFGTTPTPHHHGDRHGRGPRHGDCDSDGHGCGDRAGCDLCGLGDAEQARVQRRRSNVDIFKQLCQQRLVRHGHRPDDPANSATTGARNGDTTDAGATDHGAVHSEVNDGDGDVTPDSDPTAHDGTATAAAAAADPRGVCGRCGAAPSTARPAMLIVADLNALDPDAPVGSGTARLHWATNRAPVELTPAAAQRLACDATLRVVVTDGTQVLGVTAAHPKVSATLRAALVVRDAGCRFPACARPADLCDAHHVVPVASNGPTTLDNLALVCRDHHHAIHDGGWRTTLHDDGTLTFTRRGVTRTSAPRAHQHFTPGRPPPAGRPRRRERHLAARPTGHAADPADPRPPATGSATGPTTTADVLPF